MPVIFGSQWLARLSEKGTRRVLCHVYGAWKNRENKLVLLLNAVDIDYRGDDINRQ